VAQHGERSRWLLERLDLIAERRERRRRIEQPRSAYEVRRAKARKQHDDSQ
jgi:hypothetical protein